MNVKDELRQRRDTELERLGSSKGLMADTRGDLSLDEVLRAAKRSEYAAMETFKEWSESEENPEAESLFRSIMSDEKRHYESLDREIDMDDVPEIHRYLRGIDETESRVGAVIGRGLVSDASLKQTVAFFTGRPDREYLNLFREMRQDTASHIERAEELLGEIESIDSDNEYAVESGLRVIDIAYEEYVEVLEAMDINPKPVC